MEHSGPLLFDGADQLFGLIDALVERPRIGDRPRVLGELGQWDRYASGQRPGRQGLPMVSLLCPPQRQEGVLRIIRRLLSEAKPKPVHHAYLPLRGDPAQPSQGVEDLTIILWLASQHLTKMRFGLFTLVMWLMTRAVDHDTIDPDRALLRRIRTRALVLRFRPMVDPVEGQLDRISWWMRPLLAVGWLWFRIMVTGRVPLLSGPYRWFMRQPYLAPGLSGTFLRFAQRLASGEWRRENPEEVSKLLVNAFLEDLRKAYRLRPWQVWRKRRTTYTVLLLDNPTTGNVGGRLLQLINDVRNETGLFDPLLVITAGQSVPPGLDRNGPQFDASSAAEAYRLWQAELPLGRRAHQNTAWYLPIRISDGGSPSPGHWSWQSTAYRLTGKGTRPPWWALRVVRTLVLACVVTAVAVAIGWTTSDEVHRLAMIGAYIGITLSAVAALVALTAAMRTVLARAQMLKGLLGRRSGRPEPLNLTQFADEYLGIRGGSRRPGDIATETARLAEIELARLEPMLAARLWYLVGGTEPVKPNSPSPLGHHLVKAGAFPDGRVREVTAMVVPHGGGQRYDLVVFDPGLSTDAEPTRVPVHMPDLLTQVRARQPGLRFEEWLPGPQRLSSSSQLWPELLDAALTEASEIRDYAVLVAPAPQLVSTGGTGSGCLSVIVDGSTVGTIGVAAMTATGDSVLTTARHAVTGREDLVVSGHPSRVLAEDVVVDCSALEVSLALKQNVPAPPERLLKLSPRLHERAVFHGARSGVKQTIVTGFDPVLLAYGPHTAVRVYTNADTAGGDSGAALLDSDGHLMGFCCERTAYGAAVQYTSWVWAQQVFDLMGIKL